MKDERKLVKRLYTWITSLLFIVAIITSFSVGYIKGQVDMAETGFEILDHIKVKEINLEINETELMNTMFDRFQEEYNLNLSFQENKT